MSKVSKREFFRVFKRSDFVMTTFTEGMAERHQHYITSNFKGVEVISNKGYSYKIFNK